MSKSAGNLLSVKEVLERFSSDAVRLFILTSHYRSPLVYKEEALEASERALEKLRRALIARVAVDQATDTLDPERFEEGFIRAMDDDFNTPQALAVLFDLARHINYAAERGVNVAQAQYTLVKLAHVLVSV